jgi:hypothetical protein
MRRSALQNFFRGAIVAAIPLGLGVAQGTTPACTDTFYVAADDAGASMPVDGGGSLDCNALCGGYGYYCEVVPADGGAYAGQIACHRNTCAGSTCGRLTDGVATTGPRSDDPVTRFLEETAALEAASVLAFRRLARELTAHGAPAHLTAQALASARDEVRHARVVGALARRHGGRPQRLARTTLPVRSLVEVAEENAAEGCVRETYGALVASWQALAAAPHIREAMRGIARDEQRHAELAWSIARWSAAKLSPGERRRVRRARTGAIEALARALDAEPPAPLVRTVGLPARAVSQKLFAAARRQLWS